MDLLNLPHYITKPFIGLSSSNVGDLKFYVVSDDVTSEDSLVGFQKD